jgi:lactate racemase
LAEYKLKFGEGYLPLIIPDSQILSTIKGKETPVLQQPGAKIREVLNKPVNSRPLSEIVLGSKQVCLLVSDITRAWINYPVFLPEILNYLNDCGISDQNIHLLTALGTHRAHTQEELLTLLGNEVVGRVRVYEHDCQDKNQLVRLGVTSRGTEAWVNRKAVEADTVILTGGIVHHLFAGYGGGRKSIMPGICGWDTIQQNHNLTLAPASVGGINPLAAASLLEENPVNQDMLEICTMVKPQFLINVIPGPEGGLADIVAGDPVQAWLFGCQLVADIYAVPTKERADLVIASAGGYPKDINFYQTVKTTYNAAQAVKPGGTVILLSECRDIQEPPEFSSWLVYDSVQKMEEALRADFTIPGYAAYYAVLAAQKARFIVVTLGKRENIELIQKVGMIPVSSLEEALTLAHQGMEVKPEIIVMPNAANTFPIITRDNNL